MMIKTHLAIAVFFILLFSVNVSHPLIFFIVAFIATYIPDIDNGFSTIGSFNASRIINFFAKHRGFFHSFTFCILMSVVLAAFLPVVSFPFFLGYSIHLLTDSFTVEGIRPFWPLKVKSSSILRTGGLIERSLFLIFCLMDIFLMIILIFSL